MVILHYLFRSSVLKSKKNSNYPIIESIAIKDGMILWMINVLGLIFSGMDRFIIPSITDKTVLGAYYAISFIYVTGFSMIGSAVGYVIFPYLTLEKNIDWKRSTIFTIVFIIILFIILFFGGNSIISIAFASKYDNYVSPMVIYPILLIGLIQCFHTIIHVYIYAKCSRENLIRYGYVLFFISIFYYFSFTIFNQYYNYEIALISIHVLIIWCLKLIISLGMLNFIRLKRESNCLD